jgi:secreted PhoX family phosphatase
MSHSYSDQKIRNTSANDSMGSLIEARLSRRSLLKAAGALTALSVLPLAACATGTRAASIKGFNAVAVSTDDTVHVAPGYSTAPLYKWGDPVGHVSGSPTFKPDASNTADEQALQAGMHHDGIHYFPLPFGSASSDRGLLVMNHEYTDDGLLHTDGYANWSAEKVRKAQNAHGCSVIEVTRQNGEWQVARPSQYARRISAMTPRFACRAPRPVWRRCVPRRMHRDERCSERSTTARTAIRHGARI